MASETTDAGWMTWEEYEAAMYADVVWAQKCDRIGRVIGRFVKSNQLPAWWPGTQVIANAIMEAINAE